MNPPWRTPSHGLASRRRGSSSPVRCIPSPARTISSWALGGDATQELDWVRRPFILMTRRLYSHIAAVTDESDRLVDLCPDGTRPEDAPEVTIVVSLHAHDRRHRLRGQNDGQNGVAGREDGCPQDPAYPRTCSTWQCHGVRSIETSRCCGRVQAPLAAVIVAVDFDLRFLPASPLFVDRCFWPQNCIVTSQTQQEVTFPKVKSRDHLTCKLIIL